MSEVEHGEGYIDQVWDDGRVKVRLSVTGLALPTDYSDLVDVMSAIQDFVAKNAAGVLAGLAVRP